MCGDLRGSRAAVIFLRKMRFDLLAARTRCLQILFAEAFDFRLVALAALDFVAKSFQPMGQFRAIHCRRILLRLVQFPWL